MINFELDLEELTHPITLPSLPFSHANLFDLHIRIIEIINRSAYQQSCHAPSNQSPNSFGMWAHEQSLNLICLQPFLCVDDFLIHFVYGIFLFVTVWMFTRFADISFTIIEDSN
jgi:hypothetical protein